MQSEGARRMSNNIQNIDKGYLNCCYIASVTETVLLYIYLLIVHPNGSRHSTHNDIKINIATSMNIYNK